MEPPDIARIRYVTRNYASLQGWWLGAWALTTLPMVWAMPFIDPHPLVGQMQWLLVFFPFYFLHLWLGHRVRGYYAERFGRLSDQNQGERVLPWMLLFVGAWLADAWRMGHGGASAILLVVGLLGVWRAARGWPWRAHQLLLAAVGVGGVFALPLPGPRDDWALSIQRAATPLLVALTVCALLDHRLLVRTLRPRARSTDDGFETLDEAAR